jgi:hypothetical protein
MLVKYGQDFYLGPGDTDQPESILIVPAG